jgi:hypothetical protein
MFAKSRHGRFDSPTPAEPLGAWPAFASAPCVMFAQSRRQPGLAARRHALVGAAQATAACAMFAQSRRRTRDSAAGATTVVGRPKVAAVRDVRQINARHAGLAGPRPRLADGRRVVVDVVAAARTPCAQRRASGRGGIVRPINGRGHARWSEPRPGRRASDRGPRRASTRATCRSPRHRSPRAVTCRPGTHRSAPRYAGMDVRPIKAPRLSPARWPRRRATRRRRAGSDSGAVAEMTPPITSATVQPKAATRTPRRGLPSRGQLARRPMPS